MKRDTIIQLFISFTTKFFCINIGILNRAIDKLDNSNISIITGMNMSMNGKAVLVEFDQNSISKMYNYTLVN